MSNQRVYLQMLDETTGEYVTVDPRTSAEGVICSQNIDLQSNLNTIYTNQGNLDDLNTNMKDNLVDAINEINSSAITGIVPISQGGTGATNINDAIANLHVLGKTENSITYYVSPTGSNDNNGLTVDTPFETIAYALSKIPTYLEHDVSINLAAGTYTESMINVTGFLGSGRLKIVGNKDNPSQYIIENGIDIHTLLCVVLVEGLKVKNKICVKDCGQISNIFNCIVGNETNRISDGIHVERATCAIEYCHFINCEYGITSNTLGYIYSRDITLENCNTAFNAETGIHLVLTPIPSGCVAHYRFANAGLIIGANGGIIGW